MKNEKITVENKKDVESQISNSNDIIKNNIKGTVESWSYAKPINKIKQYDKYDISWNEGDLIEVRKSIRTIPVSSILMFLSCTFKSYILAPKPGVEGKEKNISMYKIKVLYKDKIITLPSTENPRNIFGKIL